MSASPGVYNDLAYAYGFEGDVPQALAALDRYASFLPPNDPNPIDTRGDVLALNGRYEEALAAYRKNRELNPGWHWGSALKIAHTYLCAGQYSLAEASALSVTRQANDANARAWTAQMLGEIEVGRGRLDAAVARYEEAARLLETQPPPAAFGALFRAAQIYFEQRQPEAALALGRRHPGPWASGVRGTAYLLLKNEPAAEKEFNALRAYLTPLLGEYMAGKYVDLERLLAAAYAGRSQEVTAGWQQLGSQFRPMVALEVGRAYLELGALPEAEQHLRFALKAYRMGNHVPRRCSKFPDVCLDAVLSGENPGTDRQESRSPQRLPGIPGPLREFHCQAAANRRGPGRGETLDVARARLSALPGPPAPHELPAVEEQ